MFVSSKPFQPSLKFAGKARSQPQSAKLLHSGRLQAFSLSIRLGWRCSPRSNTLAYYANYGRKSFAGLAAEVFGKGGQANERTAGTWANVQVVRRRREKGMGVEPERDKARVHPVGIYRLETPTDRKQRVVVPTSWKLFSTITRMQNKLKCLYLAGQLSQPSLVTNIGQGWKLATNKHACTVDTSWLIKRPNKLKCLYLAV